ncbi:hypothetical protein IE81DRAFT_325445 [Ceraceosorus guamensis]|uniref:RanBD1 domain-containing protein n=1 Tax=Ceraceosorus guamensis TaxID=1522189 RepID=A0A316VTP5_9BASI|nr:hypothetical protein IE81DRAFT_325445 [Ceraceosorus guamensis]PWN40574.1 hypothetical protein IE81DRAFT_325445 [Ceraceosorus guamensis]
MTSSSPPHIVRGPKNEGQPGVSGQALACPPSPPPAKSAGPRDADTKDEEAERVVEQGEEEEDNNNNNGDDDADDDDDDDDGPRAGEDAGAASGESKKRPAAEEQQERASKSNVKRSIEQDEKEKLRRKRDREGSLEPTTSAASTAKEGSQIPISTDALPAKKNRVAAKQPKEDQASPALKSQRIDPLDPDPNSDPSSGAPDAEDVTTVEGEKVGQIRQRVRDLDWKGSGDGGASEAAASEAGVGDAKSLAPLSPETTVASPSRTQPSFSSFAKPSSGFGATVSSSSPGGTPAAASPSVVTPTRTQPTFSSFSKGDSPFSSSSASIAGPSWLAGSGSSASSKKAATSQSGGGIRPSNLGSLVADDNGSLTSAGTYASQPLASGSTVRAHPSTSNNGSSSGQKQALGFGAFKSANPFAAKPTVTSSSSSSAAPSPAAASENDNAVSAEPADESAAKERHASASAAPARETSSGPSVKPLDEADLMTGEEEENVLVSARAKLYVLGDDHQSWKEKGTGTLRCNIPRRKSPLELARTGGSSQSSKRGGRLVMRTEGILRLILNVNLFPSMRLELISDRFLRFVAFEAATADAPQSKLKPTHYGLRFGSAAAASNFVDVVDSLLREMQKRQNSSKIVEEA